MPTNDLTLNQISTVLNSIASQATGKSTITPTNTNEFVSVAQTALKSGYDPVMSAISQVLGRTIFSVRPYTRKFGGLRVSNQQYGNHVRKLSPIDGEFENDDRIPLADATSVDQYKINKPKVLQTNWYGETVYQKSLTLFRDQLDVAFSGPEDFGRFIGMIMSNASDTIEQAHESLARATLANLIGGKIKGDSGNVIHLVTEYNAAAGTSLDAQTVLAPANFVPFAKWMYARLANLSDLLSERTQKYHVNIEGKAITRHTPADRQKLYLLSSGINQLDTIVKSSVFNDKFLKLADHESVTYWQAIDTPDQISVTPSYLTTTGAIAKAEAMTASHIFGVLMDEEAAGYTVCNEWSAPSPFNAKGGYSNLYWHFTDRYWNDFTENAVILCLD